MEGQKKFGLFNSWMRWDSWAISHRERPPPRPLPLPSGHHRGCGGCPRELTSYFESYGAWKERLVYWAFCWSLEQSRKSKHCKLATKVPACKSNQGVRKTYFSWKVGSTVCTEVFWVVPRWSRPSKRKHIQTSYSKPPPQLLRSREPRIPWRVPWANAVV